MHFKLKRSQLAKDDILFSMAGIYLGKNALVPEDVLPANTNQALAIIRLNKIKANPKFIHYYLRQKRIVEFVNNMSGQSAQPNINFEEIKCIDVLLPDIGEQIQIAEILSSLDDKIDLLHRQNKTLEQIAETLFRQWFVEETDSSWKIIKVKDVCITITKGTTPTTLGLKFTETGINFIKAESISDEGDLLVNKFAYIDETTHNKLNRSKIEVNDLVITIAGTIGRVALITKRILPANTNQALAILRLDKNTISHNFLYCLFKSTEFKDDFESRVVHAVQPNLSLGEIGDISFKLPDKEKLILGEKQLEVIFQKKENNNIQIQTLTKLRDTLLPKLMSGEVRVR